MVLSYSLIADWMQIQSEIQIQIMEKDWNVGSKGFSVISRL